MREIVLDTETTGLDPFAGDRVVEIGAIELFNHLPTGKTYHQYINPMRDMPAEAFAIHGISAEFLADKPVFKAVAREFTNFVGAAQLVIHNASFDMKFLNAELERAGQQQLPMSQAIDTLMLARKKFPGAQHSLDALCRRFGVDNSHRQKHGALLDSEILAEVYLELIGGRQPDFGLSADADQHRGAEARHRSGPTRRRPTPMKTRITTAEAKAHAALVESLGEGGVWRQFYD